MNTSDSRIVMTLDAGGTNLVFSAMRANERVVDEITLPTHGDDLRRCIASIVEGFRRVQANLAEKPSAISFAFPGPADYPNGIIGDAPNLPAFRGGVALGPMLEDTFGLPVFINNDGDLFAYGEAIAGYLPYVNALLRQSGSPKQYKNLLGLTLGTGFGAGIVVDGNLLLGDNSNAASIWLFRDKLYPEANVERHASIRGVKHCFAVAAGVRLEDSPEPKDIYEIAVGKKEGNTGAARTAFRQMAETAGDAIASAVSLVDGIVVLGGGLAGASEIFLPDLVKEMNSAYTSLDGMRFPRLSCRVYNLEEHSDLQGFIRGSVKEIQVLGSDRKIRYDPEMRIGVGISRMGTNKAVAIGAYALALRCLDNRVP